MTEETRQAGVRALREARQRVLKSARPSELAIIEQEQGLENEATELGGTVSRDRA